MLFEHVLMRLSYHFETGTLRKMMGEDGLDDFTLPPLRDISMDSAQWWQNESMRTSLSIITCIATVSQAQLAK